MPERASGQRGEPPDTGTAATDPVAQADPVALEQLLDGLDALVDDASAETIREEVRETKAALLQAHQEGLIDAERRVLDARDAVEAFVGSVIFASPLLVEDGIFDIGMYLFSAGVAGVPVFLIANTLFVVAMTYALVEWTGQDTAELRSFFGFPARVVMVLVVSFLVATVLMVVWGRADPVGAPVEALARINVIWTVGSLGAALGDIISESEPVPPAAIEADTTVSERDAAPQTLPEPTGYDSDGELLAAIYDHFDALQGSVAAEDQRLLRRVRDRTADAAVDDLVGDRIQKYTGRDIAEAFVGSIFFSIPFLVEDGVFDVAAYFLSFRLGGFPVYFLVNAAFVLAMIGLLVYWAGPKDVQVSRPILGFIPRRLVGIAVVSFLTAAALMTMWGRVENWQDPVVAVARISVVWTVASFGAALGDILPGESSGDDINDDIADLGDHVEDLLE